MSKASELIEQVINEYQTLFTGPKSADSSRHAKILDRGVRSALSKLGLARDADSVDIKRFADRDFWSTDEDFDVFDVVVTLNNPVGTESLAKKLGQLACPRGAELRDYGIDDENDDGMSYELAFSIIMQNV